MNHLAGSRFTYSAFDQNIALIGPRAVGKTSTALVLAELTGMPLVDTDAVLEAQGQSLAHMIQEHGPDHGAQQFRNHETTVAEEVGALTGHIIATGGGFVLRSRNVDALRKNSRIFWLYATAAVLAARIEADTTTDRPRLTSERSLEAEMQKLIYDRRSIYRQAAHERVDAGTHTSLEIAVMILRRLDIQPL